MEPLTSGAQNRISLIMRSSRATLSTIAVFAGMLTFSAQAASLYNVDFNHDGSGATPPSFPSGTMTGAAAIGSDGDVWNGITGDTAAAQALVNSTGAASSVTVTINQDNVNGSWDNDAFAATNAVALMADYININADDDGVTATVLVNNLTLNSAFTIHLFGAGDAADQRTTFAVTGANEEGSQSTVGGSTTPLASPQHYVTFTGNTGSSGEIEISWTQGGTWTAFNGFQLEVVPEPASASLLGLAAIGLLLRRNRK